MYAYEINEKTDKFRVESGHKMCHPETCSCWDFRVYDKKGENVFNSDSSKCVMEFCGIKRKG